MKFEGFEEFAEAISMALFDDDVKLHWVHEKEPPPDWCTVQVPRLAVDASLLKKSLAAAFGGESYKEHGVQLYLDPNLHYVCDHAGTPCVCCVCERDKLMASAYGDSVTTWTCRHKYGVFCTLKHVQVAFLRFKFV